MSKCYRMHDGWDLNRIKPLRQFTKLFSELDYDVYELKNCVRSKSLVEMRDSLLLVVNEMKETLEQINDRDYITEI